MAPSVATGAPVCSRMCRRRGPLHLGAALVLAATVLCDVSSSGQAAGEEQHHDVVIRSGEEGPAHHAAAHSSDKEHHGLYGEQNCGAHHSVDSCPNAKLHPHLLLAYVMLSSVVFALLVLYLLNWSNKYVRRSTYRMLCTAISVYCAVLLNEGLMGVFKVISRILNWPIEITFGLLIFLGIYATVWWLCYTKRGNHEWLMALESLGGHLMAFAGIVAFGNMMFSCWFQHTIYMPVSSRVSMQSHVRKWKYVFVIGLVVIMLLVLFGFSRLFRKKYHTNQTDENKTPKKTEAKTDEKETLVEHGDVTHESHHNLRLWIDEVSGAENEAAALIVGFLILQSSVLFITDRQPGLHDHSCKSDVQKSGIASLAGVGTLCLVIMAVIGIVKARLEGDEPGKIANINARKTMAMSAGWCIERSSKWLMIYWWDDTEVAQVSSAFLLSMLSVIVVLILSKVMSLYHDGQGHALKSKTHQSPREQVVENLLESLAVLVGLGWDHAFHVSQIRMLDYYAAHLKGFEKVEVHAFLKAVMAIILCTVVAPGWVWYLLPAANKPVEEEDDSISTVH